MSWTIKDTEGLFTEDDLDEPSDTLDMAEVGTHKKQKLNQTK